MKTISVRYSVTLIFAAWLLGLIGSAVAAPRTVSVVGSVTAKDATYFYVEVLAIGGSQKVNVTATTKYFLNISTPTTYNSVTVGSQVNVNGTRNSDGSITATTISIVSPAPNPSCTTQPLTGLVLADPSPSYPSFYIQLYNGQVWQVVVSLTTQISSDGQPATFAGILAGHYASVIGTVTETSASGGTIAAKSVIVLPSTAPPPPPCS